MMRIIFVFICLLSFFAQAKEIKPFTTDGCSAFPNGTDKQNELWLACCTLHDIAYWQGGTYQERVNADNALNTCVKQVGEPTIAALMLAGVRVGGTPYLPTPFRWGYGWPYLRGYKPISKEEKKSITTRLNEMNAFSKQTNP
jgi:hypothetical protein